MNTLVRSGLSICAAALFAGCGGSQNGTALPAGGATAQSKTHAASESYQVLFRFDKTDGWRPGNLLNVNGTLYGTTFSGGYDTGGWKREGCGTVYSISTQGVEQLLFAFSCGAGHNPVDGLTDVKGVLYGATTRNAGVENGTVYSITPSGTETRLYTFGGLPDGAFPSSPLIYVKGRLYGTTSNGGQRNSTCARAGCGTVYSIDTSGNEKVLYKFQGAEDGYYPDGLMYANGMLYGTTSAGGTLTGYCSVVTRENAGCGTFFSLSLSGTHTVLYRFLGPADRYPAGQPIEVNGTFYGTTSGTVYTMSRSGAENVLHTFGGRGDGSSPRAGLISVKSVLYGTTYEGGEYGCRGYPPTCGTIYSLTTSGTESVLHSFAGGSDGMHPRGALLYLKGTLYGTTSEGGGGDWPGHNGGGTVFAISP